MNREELVETIIKEVKRVLALRGVTVASSPASSPINGRTVPADSVPSATDNTVGRFDLTGKQVITQKDLEAFRGKSISVAKKAVITPLAFDYAREKGITITRVENPVMTQSCGGNAKTAGTVAVAIAPDFTHKGAAVLKMLSSKGFQIKEFSGDSYETAVTGIANAVSSGTAIFGVCIEKTGMEGPIYANRTKEIRAIHCRNTSDARAARLDIGANVIVIDAVSDSVGAIDGFIRP